MIAPNIEPLLPEDPRELGTYRTLGRLGAGGMGVVYLGLGPDGRQVAIKVIRREFAADPGYRARFESEVANARRVASFCTAAVLAYGEQEGMPFLVTEFVPGMSLKEYVETQGAFPAAQLRGLVIGIATALLAIHTARLVHRDLKPHNVLRAADGPRVIDFGIARATDSASQHTATGVVVGSPGWIAPEQLFENRVSTAGDIFAWGSLAAYAATGRHPYGTGNMMVLAVRAQQGAHDLSGVPMDLLPLVEAALDPDPDRRPTGERILTELMGVAAEQEAHTQISSVWTPGFLPQEPRNPVVPASTLPPGVPGGTRPPHPQPSGATWMTSQGGAPQYQQQHQYRPTDFAASVAAPLLQGTRPGPGAPPHTPPPVPLPPSGPPSRGRWIVPVASAAAVALVAGLGYLGKGLLQDEKGSPDPENPAAVVQEGALAAPEAAAKALSGAVPAVVALYSFDHKDKGSFTDQGLPVSPSFLQQWTVVHGSPETIENAKTDKASAVLKLSALGVISVADDRIEALVSGTRQTASAYGPTEESVEARVRLAKEGASWLVADVSNVDENQEPVLDTASSWPGTDGKTLTQDASKCLMNYLDFSYSTKDIHKNTMRVCLAEQALTSDLPAWQNQIGQEVAVHGTILDVAFQTFPAPSRDPVLMVSTRTSKRSGAGSEQLHGVIWRMTMKQVDGVWRAVRIEQLSRFE